MTLAVLRIVDGPISQHHQLLTHHVTSDAMYSRLQSTSDVARVLVGIFLLAVEGVLAAELFEDLLGVLLGLLACVCGARVLVDLSQE